MLSVVGPASVCPHTRTLVHFNKVTFYPGGVLINRSRSYQLTNGKVAEVIKENEELFEEMWENFRWSLAFFFCCFSDFLSFSKHTYFF